MLRQVTLFGGPLDGEERMTTDARWLQFAVMAYTPWLTRMRAKYERVGYDVAVFVGSE